MRTQTQPITPKYIKISTLTYRTIHSFIASSLDKKAPWNIPIKTPDYTLYTKTGKWVLRVHNRITKEQCTVTLSPSAVIAKKPYLNELKICTEDKGIYMYIENHKIQINERLYNDIELQRTFIIPDAELPKIIIISIADLLFKINYYFRLEQLLKQ